MNLLRRNAKCRATTLATGKLRVLSAGFNPTTKEYISVRFEFTSLKGEQYIMELEREEVRELSKFFPDTL